MCEEPFTYGAHCNFACQGSFEMIGPNFAFCDRDEAEPSRGFLNWGVNQTAPYCLSKDLSPFIKWGISYRQPHVCWKKKLFCVFIVIDCADLDPPLNGVMACGDWVNGRHCQMMCNAKYDIPRGASVSGVYICDLSSGRWHPHTIVPDCSGLMIYCWNRGSEIPSCKGFIPYVN